MDVNEILTAIRERKGVPELLHHLRCSAVSYYSADRSAASYLAYCHEIGVGVECDPYTAMLWYCLALRDASAEWQQSWVAERLASLEKMNPRPKYGVGEKIVIEDCEIGTIVNTPNDKPLVVSVKDGVVCVNGKADEPYDRVVGVVALRLAERERRRENDGLPQVIDERFERNYDHCRLRVSVEGSRWGYRIEGECGVVTVPVGTCFAQRAVRETIIGYAKRAMHTIGERYVGQRLAQLSAETGLPYGEFHYGSESGCWGMFYSKTKRVDLSKHLIKLPSRAIDAVIVHELCHQISAAHDSKFYDALRTYGGPELYRYDTNFIPTAKAPADI